MLKEICIVILILVIVFILFGYAMEVGIREFKEECRSHGGMPIISQYDSVCYAPGTIIDIGGKE